jgi:2-dehydropantoate 2-reductase
LSRRRAARIVRTVPDRASDLGRILVAGAGALGSVVGGLLARAGHDVSLLGRRAHLDAIRTGGLLIDGIFGTHRVRGLACATDPGALDGPYATVLLTVKSFDTAAMVAAVGPSLAAGGVLVSMQNGLGNIEAAERALGPARILGARVIFGSELVAPAHVRVTVIADPVAVGSPDPSDGVRAAAARRVAAALADAGVPTEATDDVHAALWAKVLYNAPLNPLGALLGRTYGELAADEVTRAVMDDAIGEAFAVARADGVALRWPDADAYRREFYERLVPSTAGHRSSMLQDIERGRRTEVDAINGQVVARAAAHGLAAPVNATLARLVRARSEGRWNR